MHCRRAIRAGSALVVVTAALLLPAAPASAAVGISGSLTVPSPVSVGQTGLAGSFRVTNTKHGAQRR